MTETNQANDQHSTPDRRDDPDNLIEQEVDATCVPAKSIKAIDKTTVHRICSGQVVLTLATAVKELVENSIDAGSTSVEVRLKEYGSVLIEVSDNGRGVEPCDFEGLTLKHHTSKLQDFGDLIGVKTFGFRGEALSSLCALSNLTVVTRHKSQTIGTKLTFDANGKLIEEAPVSRQVGTTVSLQDLFYTLPVRHKEFIRNLKKEFGKMGQVLYSYCLISTNVRILCTNLCGKNGRMTVVSTESHSSLKENISSIFGPKQVASLLEIKQRSPDEQALSEYGIDGSLNCIERFQLEGFVSSCAHGKGRSAADRQFYFINNRPCDPAKVIRVVNEVYHHYNKHQFPAVVLNIRMKEEDVDVNVTPDKRQIMVNRERLLLATIKTTLICLYESIPSILHLQNTPLGRIESTNARSPQSPTSSLTSSLVQRFSHNPSTPSSASTTGVGGKRKSIPPSKTTFGGIKRAIAAHSSFQAAAKQPKLQEFCFKVNGSNAPSQSHSNVAEQDVSLGDPATTLNGAPMDVAGEEASEARSKGLEDVCDFPMPFTDTTVGRSIEQPDTRNELTAMLGQKPETQNGSSVVTHEDSRSLNGSLIIPATSNSSESPKNPAKAFHFKTEEFLSSLRGAKKRSSFAGALTPTPSVKVSGADRDSVTQTRSVVSSAADVIIIGATQVGDDEQESPHNLNITYDDVVMTTDIPSALRGKSLTVSFSVDSLRRKLASLSSGQRKDAATEDRDVFRKFRAKIAPSNNASAEEELKKQLSREEFQQMSVIGQFNLGFIVTRLGADLFVVDQHATDEKYNFETLQRTCDLHSQKLIAPHALELTATNEGILLDNMDIFSRNGFEFEVDHGRLAGRRVALTKMPHSRGWEFSRQDVEEMIFMLSDAPGIMCRPSRVSAMFASRACRKSVMIGTALSHSHMRRLIDHMADMEQPWNCPHGRPTLRHLINVDMLARLEQGK